MSLQNNPPIMRSLIPFRRGCVIGHRSRESNEQAILEYDARLEIVPNTEVEIVRLVEINGFNLRWRASATDLWRTDNWLGFGFFPRPSPFKFRHSTSRGSSSVNATHLQAVPVNVALPPLAALCRWIAWLAASWGKRPDGSDTTITDFKDLCGDRVAGFIVLAQNDRP